MCICGADWRANWEVDRSALALIMNSLAMEIMAVTRAMIWLKSQTFTQLCLHTDSTRRYRGRAQSQWLDSTKSSRLKQIINSICAGAYQQDAYHIKRRRTCTWLVIFCACTMKLFNATSYNTQSDSTRKADTLPVTWYRLLQEMKAMLGVDISLIKPEPKMSVAACWRRYLRGDSSAYRLVPRAFEDHSMTNLLTDFQ